MTDVTETAKFREYLIARNPVMKERIDKLDALSIDLIKLMEPFITKERLPIIVEELYISADKGLMK